MLRFGKTNSAPSPGSFSTKEIQRIERRFLKLSQNGHRMPISALQSLPELAGNPFVTRIVKLYDRDNDDMVSLDEFVAALQHFRSLNTPGEKLKLVFGLYDLDKDGYVGESELIHTMKEMKQNLSDQQLEQIARSTIQEYDRDRDGKLSFNEFREMAGA